MIISNHQIHNVLKVFTSQLSKGKAAEQQKTSMDKSLSGAVSISTPTKKQGLIDRVSADIVDRITRKDAQEDINREMVDRLANDVKGDHEESGDQKRQTEQDATDAGHLARADAILQATCGDHRDGESSKRERERPLCGGSTPSEFGLERPDEDAESVNSAEDDLDHQRTRDDGPAVHV